MSNDDYVAKKIRKVVTQKEAERKYNHWTTDSNGKVMADVYLRADGTEHPSCWNMNYRMEMEKKAQSLKKDDAASGKASKKAAKPKKKGYWGWCKEEFEGLFWVLLPVLFVVWIPVLVLKIVWFIVKIVFKMVGIGFILNLFGINLFGSSRD